MHTSRPPRIEIPPSSSTVRVRAIDTTTNIICHSRAFLEPEIQTHPHLNLKTFCFLIDHLESGKKVLFDAGARVDLENLPPKVRDGIAGKVKSVQVTSGVEDILQSAGISPAAIHTVVWSHWHWDHIGDISKFPPTTTLVVGPSFRQEFTVGWPEDPDGVLRTSDLSSHSIREISFESSFQIGDFKAHDFFGDGSFYLLSLPGHAIGHLGALCRTSPETFILLGADACHFLGAMRPTTHHPLSDEFLEPAQLRKVSSCLCSLFTRSHSRTAPGEESENMSDELARRTPFYGISRHPDSVFMAPDVAQRTVQSLQAFDADQNMFLCFAHDGGLAHVVPLLNNEPDADLNSWKSLGYKQAGMWQFLEDLWPSSI
ncbi:MBL fold metallo-hydrolase [Aspergillus brunneoviolaceus CBS 621.78]|uniref:Beta-lactamase-like protein n=1 Tax=Aspergillus brunneoviolaceus CBS 621.78 TaxID=1450534 RepID=A0ACD1GKZ2_9EURO|nr:beta-lactamase-like protein [Aspergillus brunneoviolaceus CBS 621.78]RAH49741.1 beta-lactamase-like protein [Aspergillus brunneoviolaceus CBS 621.78]